VECRGQVSEVTTTCAACGSSFSARSPRARFCREPACRRQRERARKRAKRVGAPVEPEIVQPVAAAPRPAGGVFAATLSALQQAGRVATPAAQIAIALSVRIDHGAEDTGSSLAALSREHRAALGQALEGAGRESSPLDEIKAQRQKRLNR
jgi:hypothetical protein